MLVWAESRKVADTNQPQDWQQIGVDSNIKLFTMHPEAESFAAPEVDPECPELKFKDQKELEKKVKRYKYY